MSDQKAVDEFCRAVGELVLWTSVIDARLTKAICLMSILDASAMAQALVAEIEFRRKVELLKTRANGMPRAKSWKGAILKWAKLAEKVNGHRNTVAHHHLGYEENRFVLTSQQATRILKNMGREPVDLKHVLQWIELAKTCVDEGDILIRNLEAFAAKWREQTLKGAQQPRL